MIRIGLLIYLLTSLNLQADIAFKSKDRNFTSSQVEKLHTDPLNDWYVFRGTDEEFKKISSKAYFQEPIHFLKSQTIETKGARPIFNQKLSPYQWWLKNQEQDLIEDITDIHTLTVNGQKGQDVNVTAVIAKHIARPVKEIKVAVIDSGLDWEHPDLINNLAKNEVECNEFGNPPHGATEDKDGNGFKGDCLGYNFVDDNNITNDDDGHGTHISGIIAASSKNNGIMGVMPFAKIIPIKAMGPTQSGVGGFSDRVAKSILYAIEAKADIINMSLGWPKVLDTQHVRESVKKAKAAGILLVAAAGNNNSNSPISPCNYEEVICVGATNVDGALSDFSNHGAHVDFLAPGSQVLSTNPTLITPLHFSLPGYEVKSGTSQAAPMVAGALAWLKALFPEASHDTLYAKLAAHSLPAQKSANGLIQVKPSVEKEEVTYLAPIFKGSHLVVAKNEGVEIPVPIKNYSQSKKEVKITLQLVSGDIIAFQTSKTLSLASSETQEISFKGSIKALPSAEGHLQVSLVSGDFKKSFSRHISLVSSIESHPTYSSVELKDAGLNLKTLDIQFSKSSQIEFYQDIKNPVKEGEKGNPSLTIKIWKTQGDVLEPTTHEFADTVQLLNFYRLDLDFDGSDDLFLRTIALNSEGSHVVRYHYLDSQMNPLWENSFFDYDGSETLLDPNRLAFQSQNYGKRKIRVPYFLTEGPISKADRTPDPWDPDPIQFGNHIYFLEAKAQTFTLRTLDSHIMRQEFRETYNIEWNHFLSVPIYLYQSSEAFEKDEFYFLISTDSTPSQAFTMKIKNGQVSLLEREETFFRLDRSLIKGKPGSLSFFAIPSPITLEYSTIDAQGRRTQQSFTQGLTKDHFASIVGTFPNQNKTILESRDKLIVIDDKGEAIGEKSIHRTSFIQGRLFSEIFQTLFTKNDSGYIFLDSTNIFSNKVSVIKMNKNLSEKISNSLWVPNGCVTMNPIALEDEIKVNLLCKKGERIFLESVLLE